MWKTPQIWRRQNEKQMCWVDEGLKNESRQVALGKVSGIQTPALKLSTSWLRLVGCGRFFFSSLFFFAICTRRTVKVLNTSCLLKCLSSAVWTRLQRDHASQESELFATSPSIIPSSLFATWAQMSGTANRSFCCYGSDAVTFKFPNLSLSGVGVERSGSDVAVGPNCSKAPFHMEMENHPWPLLLAAHFRNCLHLWCHKGGDCEAHKVLLLCVFLPVWESPDPGFQILI